MDIKNSALRAKDEYERERIWKNALSEYYPKYSGLSDSYVRNKYGSWGKLFSELTSDIFLGYDVNAPKFTREQIKSIRSNLLSTKNINDFKQCVLSSDIEYDVTYVDGKRVYTLSYANVHDFDDNSKHLEYTVNTAILRLDDEDYLIEMCMHNSMQEGKTVMLITRMFPDYIGYTLKYEGTISKMTRKLYEDMYKSAVNFILNDTNNVKKINDGGVIPMSEYLDVIRKKSKEYIVALRVLYGDYYSDICSDAYSEGFDNIVAHLSSNGYIVTCKNELVTPRKKRGDMYHINKFWIYNNKLSSHHQCDFYEQLYGFKNKLS